MPYSTQTDIVSAGVTPAQLIQLTDDNGDGVADTAVITETIAEADAEIDPYLVGRYPVPVSPVPALLRQISVAITAWKLHGRRGLSNERRQKDYDDAVAKLKDLAAGRIALPALGGGEVESVGSDLPAATSSPDDRIFTTGRPSDDSQGTLDSF